MSLKRPAASALMLALVFAGLGLSPLRLQASPVTTTYTYRLTDTDPAGSTPLSQVAATVSPNGAIVPLNPSQSPLTVLPGSSGFDASNLQVLLGTGTGADGSAAQALGLSFGNGGLAPGGVLNFSLQTSPTVSGPLQFTLPTGTSDVSIQSIAATTSGGGSNGSSGSGGGNSPSDSGGGGSVTVPEPMSAVVWCGLLGLGAWQSRRRRPQKALN